MKTGGKILLGVAAVGAVGALAYFFSKRRGMTLIPSDPSEWALPSFTTTTDFMAAPPPPGLSECVCPPGTTPFRRPDGSCRCAELSVEVLPMRGSPCRSSSACAPGDICINGQCADPAEWES